MRSNWQSSEDQGLGGATEVIDCGECKAVVSNGAEVNVSSRSTVEINFADWDKYGCTSKLNILSRGSRESRDRFNPINHETIGIL